MLAPLITALVAAVVLLAILIRTRRHAAELQRESATAIEELEADASRDARERSEIEARHDTATASVKRLETENEQQERRVKTLQTSAVELRAANRELSSQITLLQADNERLGQGFSDIEPQTLWELELQRSERTWRHSVSVAPESTESPLLDSDDLLRTAVEIEAAALKEEAGAFISVDWQAAPVQDAARAHLILRLAQEMLAEAAREPIPVCLVSSGTGAVTLSLEPAEEGDKGIEIDLRPPDIAGQLIELTDGHRAQVTINYS